MEKLFNTVSVAAGVIGGTLVKMLGGFDITLRALVVMIALDYISGVVKAVSRKQLSSEAGFKGILRKITILLVVAASVVIEELLGGGTAVREIVIMFYIANEGISLLENAASVSGHIPQKLKDILFQLRGGEDDGK
ncbi:MAG TPA: phage holin family protein [Candidatus Ornithomonoglobus intestinigallinarum]|uniref:Phage holin family protein n=1 Tax=Candidatus Ornithomonoglobus intestinigallinarum TaxID=2840894 RepID=A0A9D1KPX4_9FIRM|nr:phage holin family protein [Candidatus Ornithomonoglobus intestinigallinarum]